MAYKSDIRDSTISELLQKVEKMNYSKYLVQMTLNSIRGFNEETIKFDFPVTALIGPNGGGKSTILGAAACAYFSEEVRPNHLFKRSNPIDKSMENWKISYEFVDKEESRRDFVYKMINFRYGRWNRGKLLRRNVVFFPVARTRPATEVKKIAYCASDYFEYQKEQEKEFTKDIVNYAGKILGKDISHYSQIDLEVDGTNMLLKGQTKNGTCFSEFHFGAGEASVIKMIYKIENMPENSLILIEEIENGLHPVATRKIVEYFIDVADRKKSQIIFTTHSNDALMPLPTEAIWATIDNKLLQGKLDVKSLRAITGGIDASLAIFVEDMFAKMWIEAIIAENSDIKEDEIAIFEMAGDSRVITMNKQNNLNPVAKCKSICFIDGDSQQNDSADEKIYRLPGHNPESYILKDVFDITEQYNEYLLSKELSLLLQKRPEDCETILDIMDASISDIGDPHLIFDKIGNKIGYTHSFVVKNAFLRFWARHCTKEAEKIANTIKENMK
jgi:predicted ATPase